MKLDRGGSFAIVTVVPFWTLNFTDVLYCLTFDEALLKEINSELPISSGCVSFTSRTLYHVVHDMARHVSAI